MFLLKCSLLLSLIVITTSYTVSSDLILGRIGERDVLIFDKVISLPAIPTYSINFPFIHMNVRGKYSFISAKAIEPGTATLVSGGLDNIYLRLNLSAGYEKPLKYGIKLYIKPGFNFRD